MEKSFAGREKLIQISRVCSTKCTCPVCGGLGSLFMQTAFFADSSPGRKHRVHGAGSAAVRRPLRRSAENIVGKWQEQLMALPCRLLL